MKIEVTHEQYVTIMCAIAYTRNRYTATRASASLDPLAIDFYNKLLIPVRETIKALEEQKHED